MIKIPPNRRVPFAALVLGTIVVLAGLWFVLVRPQQATLKKKFSLIRDAKEKAQIGGHNVELIEKYKSALQIGQRNLNQLESKMPMGDVYRWIIRMFSEADKSSNVEISNFDPPQVSEANPLSRTQYRVASFSIAGLASYHDFGTYLAKLENSYPNLRIQKLDLEPARLGDANSEDAEKLNFRIEVTLLVKPSTN